MDFRHLRTFIGEHITFLKKKNIARQSKCDFPLFYDFCL